MNMVCLMGRLTKDVDVKNTADRTVARYTLAVDRIAKDKSADFISCVCFDKVADFAQRYLHKGMKVAIEGKIRTGSYTNKDGQKVYTTDVIVNTHHFCESKASENKAESTDDFMNVPADVDEEVPWS